MSSQRCLKFVQSVLPTLVLNQGEILLKSLVSGYRTDHYKSRLLNGLRVTAARPGVVNFELPIEKHHTNRLNILHGGTIASMVDLGGSLAVASRGLFATGVSTDLNGTFTSDISKLGWQNWRFNSRIGKTLAYTSINFHNEKQELVARGSHTKSAPPHIRQEYTYVSFAWKDPNNIVEEMSPKPDKKE
ncbi:hypothetical protein E4T43_05931 [Aureobasidium subglaciale]|nr:hypothetical protein E4T43_05931 [Aureobasidium subglaciale]